MGGVRAFPIHPRFIHPLFILMAYLLPCTCSAEVVVTAGQAGGSVDCPRCGRVLSVPKLRDLDGLRRHDTGEIRPVVAWRPASAVALLGAILALAAWLGAAWLAPDRAGAVDDAVLRSAVLSADDLAIYRVWSEGLSRAGVRRPPAEEEQIVLRRAQYAEGMRSVLHTAAVGAALASAGAMLVLWSAKRPSPGRDAHSGPGRARP